MARQNGYIQLEVKNGRAKCHIFPSVDGGKPVRAIDAEEYLRGLGLSDYDHKAFRDVISSNVLTVFEVGMYAGPSIAETMMVKVSLDKMKVTCTFVPPSIGGSVMNVKDIMAQLSSSGVIIGINQDAILDFIKNRKYGVDYIFAEGKPPVIGHDGRIEYLFNTNPNLKPKHNEDGSVDYHNVNTISLVYEGETVARMIEPDYGEKGQDVTGKDIPTRKVNAVRFGVGKNVKISDDGTELIATRTGHVTLAAGKVQVSSVYEVNGDVGSGTGNINFNGSVHVKGNVNNGFAIIADGNVVVDGVVEGALIQANGEIVVKQGIHGVNKAVLDATGNVMSQFIENAKVFAGGFVEAGSIIYSEVNAAEDVNVLEQKGFLIGGVVRAGGKVESISIGSVMGTNTRIEVGMAPEKKERYSQLGRSIQAMQKKIDKLNPIVDTYNSFIEAGRELDEKNAEYLERLMAEMTQTKMLLESSRAEYNGLHQELINSKHSQVIVHGEIYPEVEIVVSDISIRTMDNHNNCSFRKKDGQIVVGSI